MLPAPKLGCPRLGPSPSPVFPAPGIPGLEGGITGGPATGFGGLGPTGVCLCFSNILALVTIGIIASDSS